MNGSMWADNPPSSTSKQNPIGGPKETPTPPPPSPLSTITQAISTKPPSNIHTTADYDNIIGGLRGGRSIQELKTYLLRKDANELKRGVRGWGFISALVELNNPEALALLLRFDLDVNVKNVEGLSVLAHAIMYAKVSGENVLEMVKMLLSEGADPEGVPRDMWENYIETPKASVSEGEKARSKPWSTKNRMLLAETLTLSLRYSLWRTSRVFKITELRGQIAEAHEIKPLFKIAHSIIGQEKAASLVIHKIFARFAKSERAKPLVLAFAGLSGHGKTELASQLGPLLSLQMVEIDMTQINDVWALLGAPLGYVGNEEGSPLDNFLRAQSGNRSIVFLDEYEKTNDEVRQALMKVMESGKYTERSANKTVDCSGTIWILGTNAGAAEIKRFHKKHISSRNVIDVDISPLLDELRTVFSQQFTEAVTGRINAYIPFFPFTPNEQAVIAHKFLLQLCDGLRKPVDLDNSVRRYVGHSILTLADDVKICRLLAKDGYNEGTGARSLMHRIDDLSDEFVMAYTDSDEKVTVFTNGGPMARFVVKCVPTEGGGEKLAIVRDGEEKGSKTVWTGSGPVGGTF